MLKRALLILLAAIVVFVIVAALQPDDFRVTRTAVINAPPAAVFEQVNTLRNWDAWSPWAKLDPAAKNTFEGPASGVGSALALSGNNQVGEGRMTILDSKPGELVRLKLDFVKPMKDTSTTEFNFQPEGAGTKVSWSMFGKRNLIGKAMGLFMNCDKMLGGYFEQGLTQLKTVAEGARQS